MLTPLQAEMIKPMDIVVWDGYARGMVVDTDEHRVLVAIHAGDKDLVTWLNKRSDRLTLISDERLFGQKCPWPVIGCAYSHASDKSSVRVTDIVSGYVLYTNSQYELKALPIDEFNKRRGYP